MSDNRRVLRVERELKQLLARILVSELKVPLPGFASVVEVSVTGDLRSAKVYIRIAGGPKEREEAEALLGEQRAWIQQKIGRELQMKFCPVLKFIFGSSAAGETDEVDRLLANLHRRQA